MGYFWEDALPGWVRGSEAGHGGRGRMPSRAPAHLIAAPTPTPRECAFATPHQHANEMHGNEEKSLPIPQFVEIDSCCGCVVKPFDI